MPFVDKDREKKQNEENTLIDFRIHGKQITLQRRPSPCSSRSSSRIETAFRSMSATPSLYLEESHRKTPPWTRPHSADHLSREGSQRRKLAAKFDRCSERRGSKTTKKTSGSMSNLLDSSSFDDDVDSGASVTPSPVPSLSDVLRPTKVLHPGLATKPPLPQGSRLNSDLIESKKNYNSIDDIINIKFQRWFPESVQNKCLNSVDETRLNQESVHSISSGLSKKKVLIDNDYVPLSKTPETEISRIGNSSSYQFDVFDGSPAESGSNKKISRSHTMETIVEHEDTCAVTSEKAVNQGNSLAKGVEAVEIISNTSTLNKYLGEAEDNRNKKKKLP